MDEHLRQDPQARREDEVRGARPSRDEVFLRTALLFAQRSTCTRGHVGAVAVQDRRIVATGYNGAPPGAPECIRPGVGCDLSLGGEAGCQRAIHAEANLVAWAARHGTSLLGATVYCTHSPCGACARLLLAAGISRFAFLKEYRLGRDDILIDGGVMVGQVVGFE